MSEATTPDETTESPEQDGVLERVVEEVTETAHGVSGFVARMGGALSDGFRDGRQSS